MTTNGWENTSVGNLQTQAMLLCRVVILSDIFFILSFHLSQLTQPTQLNAHIYSRVLAASDKTES